MKRRNLRIKRRRQRGEKREARRNLKRRKNWKAMERTVVRRAPELPLPYKDNRAPDTICHQELENDLGGR